MGHAEVDNKTPYALQQLFLADEDGRPLFVPLVQATYDIRPAQRLALAERQPPPSLTGELWGDGDPATASYRIEPAFAFTKLSTDVVLVGHAHALRGSSTEISVTFRVGAVGKVVRVVGDRFWVRAAGAFVASRPQRFDRIPLCYERAFGGWDRSHPDPARHAFEPRNPVGTGFRAPDGRFEEGIRLPNIEDPAAPIERYGQAVPPAGVGFVAPHWHARAAFAGTYDETWRSERMPLLPKDFDRRFFNAASPGLVAPGYLAGDEPVVVENASAFGHLAFRLPGLPAPRCRVELNGSADAAVELHLDTLVVDTDADRVLLLYRGCLALSDSPHSVKTIVLDGTLGHEKRTAAAEAR